MENEVFSHLTINSMETSNQVRDEAYTYLEMKLEEQKLLVNLRVKVDTGAQGNTLPLRMFREMFPQSVTKEGLPKEGTVNPSQVVLTAYNGTVIPQHGCVVVPCKYKSSTWQEIKFFVVETLALPSSVCPARRT